jgi:hypothetical protein
MEVTDEYGPNREKVLAVLEQIRNLTPTQQHGILLVSQSNWDTDRLDLNKIRAHMLDGKWGTPLQIGADNTQLSTNRIRGTFSGCVIACENKALSAYYGDLLSAEEREAFTWNWDKGLLVAELITKLGIAGEEAFKASHMRWDGTFEELVTTLGDLSMETAERAQKQDTPIILRGRNKASNTSVER